eukprot:2121972-Amphidinium_carterae.1
MERLNNGSEAKGIFVLLVQFLLELDSWSFQEFVEQVSRAKWFALPQGGLSVSLDRYKSVSTLWVFAAQRISHSQNRTSRYYLANHSRNLSSVFGSGERLR